MLYCNYKIKALPWEEVILSIKDIKYFVEVVEAKSFTKAAEKMHLTQPAISKSIRLLEQDINIKLINREAKHFELTEDGESFYVNAKKAIIAIDLELAKLHDSLKIKQETIIVGIPPVIASVYFPGIVASFKEQNPHINVLIAENGSNKIKLEVAEGIIEVGAVVTPVKSDKVVVNHVIYGDVVAVVSSSHKLANRTGIDICELKEEKFITFTEEFMMYNKIIEVCNKVGFEPEIIFKSSQWDFIMEMVALSQGITLMPKAIVDRFKIPQVVLLPVKSPSIKWNVAIVTKKHRYLSNAATKFIKHIIENT